MTVADLKRLPAPAPLPATRLGPSGRAETMPTKLAPMLAELAEAPFTHPDWLFEPKLDGYRVLAFVHGGEVKLRSRRGLDLTPAFPAIAAELAGQSADGMIVDGEVVALDAAGRPSFNALQNRAQLKTPREIAAAERDTPAVFYCFDLLHFAGLDLRQAAYSDRRRYLAQCLLPSPHVQLVHASEDGVALYAAALAQGFEGVIAKRRDSRYEAGRRSNAWLKIKPLQRRIRDRRLHPRQGRTRAARRPPARLLGKGPAALRRPRRQRIRRRDPGPAEKRLERARDRACTRSPSHRRCTAPRPGCGRNGGRSEVRGMDPDGYLRAPVFLRLREDVDPKSVRRSEAEAHSCSRMPGGMPDTSVDEVLRQLEDSAAGVHPGGRPAPHQADPSRPRLLARRQDAQAAGADQARPAALPGAGLALSAAASRRPAADHDPHAGGIGGERFFQKHWEPPLPDFAESVTVFSESRDERHDYLVCNNLPTLLWLGSRARSNSTSGIRGRGPGGCGRDSAPTIRVRPPALERSLLNYPDYLVFDLDPYIYSGQEAAGAEPEYSVAAFDKGKEVRLPAARGAAGDGTRAAGEDLGQDRPAYLRADRAHARLRRGARARRPGRPPSAAAAPQGHHHGLEHRQAQRQDLL
jgi:bifunctional non-homologous end joining protein LigD